MVTRPRFILHGILGAIVLPIGFAGTLALFFYFWKGNAWGWRRNEYIYAFFTAVALFGAIESIRESVFDSRNEKRTVRTQYRPLGVIILSSLVCAGIAFLYYRMVLDSSLRAQVAITTDWLLSLDTDRPDLTTQILINATSMGSCIGTLIGVPIGAYFLQPSESSPLTQ